jgi:hypothetical protein
MAPSARSAHGNMPSHAPAPVPQYSWWRRLLLRAAALAHALIVCGLIASALDLRNVSCESAGCTGLGVAWLAWAATFGVLLGVGALLRTRVPMGRLRRLVHFMWWLQWLAGAALVAEWAGHRLSQ